MSKKYKIEKIDENNKSEAEIKGEIPADIFREYINKQVKEIQKDFEAKGFRKGHVPEDIIRQNIDKNRLLNESANYALKDIYLDVIEESEIDVMGLPQVSITKMAEGDDLGFSIKVGIFPETKLPDYKKISKEILSDKKDEKIEATEEEVQKVIDDIMRIYGQATEAKKEKDKSEDKDTIVDKDGNPIKKDKEETKKPELTDEFVKNLGKFESVEDFKKKIESNVKLEKVNERKKEKREKLAKELTEKTEVTIPEIVINQEMQSFLTKLVEDLKKKEMTIEEYLEKTGKKQEEFLEEQKEYVKNQIKMRLILEAIARKEDIKVDENEINQQLQLMKRHYPDSSEENLRNYVSVMIANEKVINLLEEEAKK